MWVFHLEGSRGKCEPFEWQLDITSTPDIPVQDLQTEVLLPQYHQYPKVTPQQVEDHFLYYR